MRSTLVRWAVISAACAPALACSSSPPSSVTRRVLREAGAEDPETGGKKGSGGTTGIDDSGAMEAGLGGTHDAATDVDASVGGPPDASVTDDGGSRDSGSPRDASADAGRPKLVFVSSALYGANLGGVAGADAKCQALATAAHLQGNFKAWLSDESGSPSTRFTRTEADYVLSDGTVFAHGWTGLTTKPPAAALTLTEKGTPPPTPDVNRCALPPYGHGSAAWTSTNSNGTAASGVADGLHTCRNWTVSSPSEDAVSFGDATGSGSWVSFCNTQTEVCTFTASLFCFEQ